MIHRLTTRHYATMLLLAILLSMTVALTSAREAEAATGADVVSAARSYLNLGITYKYNTCTSTQMSCTCLTKKTFAKFGYALPMDEAGQVRYGRAVSRAALQPGDLVYFKENGSGGPITHVGIYSKPGYIIHSSPYYKGVHETQMRYTRGYAGARRLV